MYKIAFETFGCRLNQAETATLARQFMARGYEVIDDPLSADLYVVNTCNLTSPATSKCRRKIRSVIRRNPGACVAAIGCYAQTDAENLKEIEGLDYIVGTSDKLRLAEIIPEPVKLPEPLIVNNPVDKDTFTIDEVGHYPWNTRANLKVQEGCDFVCSFCIVPRSRGRARSREFGNIVDEARLLAEATPAAGGWKDWGEDLVLKCHTKETGKSYCSVYGRMRWDAPAPPMHPRTCAVAPA